MQTITFSEQLFNEINPIYVCKTETITFTGEIVSDGSNPTSPVIAYDTTYMGPVTWTFSKPVSHLELDAGYFDETGTTIVQCFDSHGTMIESRSNKATGIEHFSFTHADIASVVVKSIGAGADTNGFAVDNVSFKLAPPAVDLTGNADIDGVMSGYRWDHHNITFSFPVGPQDYTFNGYQYVSNFQALTTDQQTAARSAIAMFGNVCGLTFSESGGPNADIRFGQSSAVDYSDGRGVHTPADGLVPAEGVGPNPANAPVSWGDVWLDDTSAGENSSPTPGSFTFAAALMGEIGVALGLKHGSAHLGAHGQTFPALPGAHNSQEFSVMSTNTYVGGSPADPTAADYPTTLMQDDIAALQKMYGADFSYNNTDTVYTWDQTTGEESVNGVGQGAPSNHKIFMTVWDGGGTDTYDFSSWTNNLKIDLNPGAFSLVSPSQLADLGDGHSARGNIANALLFNNNKHSLIENANGGSGNDTLTGNVANNVLNGNGGNDVFTPGTGDDRLNGNAGNDVFNMGADLNAADRIDGGANTDTVKLNGDYSAGVTFNATTMVRVELLKLSAGHSYKMITNDANVASGATLKVDGSALGTGESLTFNGSHETDGRFNILGGAGKDVLTGGAGDDVINAGGGDDWLTLSSGGNDAVSGGDGKDTFVMGGALTASDKLDGGTGFDTVLLNGDYSTGLALRASTISNMEEIKLSGGHSYRLTTNDANVGAGLSLKVDGSALGSSDSLVFNGSHETNGRFNILGGAGSDKLTGGAGNDVLTGGTGNDTLTGGGGADHFVYTSASQSSGSGHDIIVGFDATADKFDLSFAVTGIDTKIGSGALSTASFNTDMAAAIGAAQLAAHHAVLFTPDSGSLSGHTFLIVDANGVAGYQKGLDLVFDLQSSTHLAGLSTADFI